MKDDKVSSTALTVLQGILYSANKKEFSHLVSNELKEACKKILLSCSEGKKRLKQLNSKLFNISVPLIEKLMIPGITLHYVLRKNYIEEYVREAISRGFSQIINLGAGFDTLAYRLSKEFGNVHFIEIDHPATQSHKKDALIESKVNNFHLLSVDFAKQNLKDELKNFTEFHSNKPSIFISEGVLMYLNEESVKELFYSLKKLSDSDMEFIFTFIEPISENKKSYGILLKLYLKIKSENLFWNIKKEEIKNFLKSINYEQKLLIDSSYFKEKYLNNITTTIHEGECIVIAK